VSKGPKRVGLIAEDESDISAIKEILKNITGKQNIGFKHFIGRGCGKIRRKADDWARQLKLRGCTVLILIHDLDRNRHSELHKLLCDKLQPFTINSTLICIPIEEMEAWFLADEKGIKSALNLPRTPKVYHNPEKVKSPKEILGQEIEKASGNTLVYMNTKHNAIIAKAIDIKKVKSKCLSFIELYEFAVKMI
jgi:hypothetical protein